jgi:flagellar motor switch protein FliN/FliY
MNQMMGAAATALSNILDRLVNISPPTAEMIELDDVIQEGRDWFNAEERIVVTSFNLKVGDIIDSTFKQLSSYNFVKNMAASLLDGETGLINNTMDEEQVEEEIEEIEEEIKKEVDLSVKKEFEQKREVSGGSDSGMEQESRLQSGNEQRENRSKNIEQEEKVNVQSAQFPEFGENETQPLPNNMQLIKDVPLEVTVRLGKTVMKIKDIIELDKLAGEPVDLLVNGKLVAKGEVVVIDENFGFRVKDIISPADRLDRI